MVEANLWVEQVHAYGIGGRGKNSLPTQRQRERMLTGDTEDTAAVARQRLGNKFALGDSCHLWGGWRYAWPGFWRLEISSCKHLGRGSWCDLDLGTGRWTGMGLVTGGEET